MPFSFDERPGGTNCEGEGLNPKFLETQGSRDGSGCSTDCNAEDAGSAFHSCALSDGLQCIAKADASKPAQVCRNAPGETRYQCVERPHCQPRLAGAAEARL